MNKKTICPKCNSNEVIKNGKIQEKQRFKCKNCGLQFTRTTPRGRPLEEKAMAIMLYAMGVSMNAIARLLNVSTPAVLYWIRKFAISTYEKPQPTEAVVIELDEMWHFLNSKKTKFGYGKHIVVIPVNSLTGNVAGAIKIPWQN